MTIPDIFPNSDNFYRFCTTIGMALFVFAVVYPIEKQQKIDIEIKEYEKQIDLFDLKVKQDNAAIIEMNNFINNAIKNKDNSKSTLDKADIYHEKAKEIKNLTAQKLVINKCDRERIALLQSHADKFEIISIGCFIVGIPLLGFGLWMWYNQQHKYQK